MSAGTGFPPDVAVTIGFDDGSPPLASVPTTSEGTFLASIPVPNRTRVGQRQLIASATGGVVASVSITVLGPATRPAPVLPGFGLG